MVVVLVVDLRRWRQCLSSTRGLSHNPRVDALTRFDQRVWNILHYNPRWALSYYIFVCCVEMPSFFDKCIVSQHATFHCTRFIIRISIVRVIQKPRMTCFMTSSSLCALLVRLSARWSSKDSCEMTILQPRLSTVFQYNPYDVCRILTFWKISFTAKSQKGFFTHTERFSFSCIFITILALKAVFDL